MIAEVNLHKLWCALGSLLVIHVYRSNNLCKFTYKSISELLCLWVPWEGLAIKNKDKDNQMLKDSQEVRELVKLVKPCRKRLYNYESLQGYKPNPRSRNDPCHPQQLPWCPVQDSCTKLHLLIEVPLIGTWCAPFKNKVEGL